MSIIYPNRDNPRVQIYIKIAYSEQTSDHGSWTPTATELTKSTRIKSSALKNVNGSKNPSERDRRNDGINQAVHLISKRSSWNHFAERKMIPLSYTTITPAHGRCFERFTVTPSVSVRPHKHITPSVAITRYKYHTPVQVSVPLR